MPQVFHSDIRQFPTIAAFAAYLRTLPKPDWPGAGPHGTTAHNTYRPLASQWRGGASMLSMVATYKAKTPPWDRGPHFYFVVGAPNPKHDGIWMMTPPMMPGIHAGDCNADRFGGELVGDFQDNPPSAALQQLFLDGTAALHRWAGIGPVLNAHRDCMAGRTCPGDALYAIMPQLRARLAVALAPPADPFLAWGSIAKPEGAAQGFGIAQAWLKNKQILGACLRGEVYDIQGTISRALFQGGELRYFVPTGAVELLPYPQKLPEESD